MGPASNPPRGMMPAGWLPSHRFSTQQVSLVRQPEHPVTSLRNLRDCQCVTPQCRSGAGEPDSLTDRDSRVIRKGGQAALNGPRDRLHQIAPRIGENGDTVGCDQRRTALVWPRKPRSDTTDHDHQQLRRPVLYPTELRAREVSRSVAPSYGIKSRASVVPCTTSAPRFAECVMRKPGDRHRPTRARDGPLLAGIRSRSPGRSADERDLTNQSLAPCSATYSGRLRRP